MSDQAEFDVIVVGGGVFGQAAALELASRGHTVAVIDRLGVGHPATSSTGRSRGIRIAYDHPFYVDLALDAIRRWRSLEIASGRTILHLTGQLDFGLPTKLRAIVEAVREAGGAIEELDAAGFRRRFPELDLQAEEGALFHAEAGTVLSDEGLAALCEAAGAAGGRLFSPERVIAIDDGVKVTVTTDRRVLRARAVVVAAGPWTSELLKPLGIDVPLGPAIAQVTFIDAPELLHRPGLGEWLEGGDGGVYGHPVPGVGYKFAFATGQDGWSSDVTEWTADPAEEARLLAWLAWRMPSLPRRVQRTQRHPWTMSPDGDFIIDRRGGVVMACGCSGHAFKFGPALGPLVADMVEGAPANPLFARDRAQLGGTIGVNSLAQTPINR